MINFSGIPKHHLLGRILRFPLRLIPPGTMMPILQGQLRGKKWLVGAGSHGFWLGSYEFTKQKLFSETVRNGSVVYDVGANAGFYTLLASVLVGSTGRVFAFEPLPRNLRYLRRHIAVNRCDNVTVIAAAAGEASGRGLFKEDPNPSAGHLSRDEGFPVEVVSLDTLVGQGRIPPPDYLKVDVEGAELHVLQGAKRMLERYHPAIFLAVHGDDRGRDCRHFLRALGFELRTICEGNRVEDIDAEIFGVFPGSGPSSTPG